MAYSTAWPKAYPELDCRAGFKRQPEDFLVDETLAVEPAGSGEHLFLRIEKRAVPTRRMVENLAALYSVAGIDVGYAGMKDKRAVSRQWFSVRTPLDAEVACAAGYRVLESSRHERKLRRGQLSRNTFAICLRDVTGEGWADRLGVIAANGVPNYFGPQRFGRDNLAQALAWLPRRRRRQISSFKRGLYLSVLRSYLFNEVVASRVRHCSWRDMLPGDVAWTDADGSHGAHSWGNGPTGPLWGRGRSATANIAGRLESAALAGHEKLCDDLEHAGLRQQRRPMLLAPRDLTWEASGHDVLLQFQLAPGSYATSLLLEAFALDSYDASDSEAFTRRGSINHESL